MNNQPLARGTEVLIKKGTTLRSTNPKKRSFVAGRTYKVKISDSYCSYGQEGTEEYHAAEVSWAGASGYWTYADFDQVEIVNE